MLVVDPLPGPSETCHSAEVLGCWIKTEVYCRNVTQPKLEQTSAHNTPHTIAFGIVSFAFLVFWETVAYTQSLFNFPAVESMLYTNCQLPVAASHKHTHTFTGNLYTTCTHVSGMLQVTDLVSSSSFHPDYLLLSSPQLQQFELVV